MKRRHSAIAVCLALASCTGNPGPDDITSVESAVSIGQASGNFLTRLSTNLVTMDEFSREQDTLSYYQTVGISPDGTAGAGTIASNLNTLKEFQDFYRRESAKANIDYVPMDTSVSFDRALLQYLLQRQKRF